MPAIWGLLPRTPSNRNSESAAVRGRVPGNVTRVTCLAACSTSERSWSILMGLTK
ncbi:MAG: hypothetical protein ABSH16_10355 [Sedimentisphaerales bacterium]